MKIFICKDEKTVREFAKVIDIHVSYSMELTITYFNFETKPFTVTFYPEKWDSIILNKKVV